MNTDFTYHCRYTKYLYQKPIKIIRVECLSCGSTHALIPEFSLPGTSVGTFEANQYVSLRRNGESQNKASKLFSSRGMSEKYGRQFERRLRTAKQRAMALFPDEKNILHDTELLFNSRDESKATVIQFINQAFANEGYNPLYFSRRNILRVRENKLGISTPLNKGTTWFQVEPLDSS